MAISINLIFYADGHAELQHGCMEYSAAWHISKVNPFFVNLDCQITFTYAFLNSKIILR